MLLGETIMAIFQKQNWWLPRHATGWEPDMLICHVRYQRLYSLFLRNTHRESFKSGIQNKGASERGGISEFSVHSHAEKESSLSWQSVSCLWRWHANHFTNPLSLSLQCRACLSLPSLQSITGRSSLIYFCVSHVLRIHMPLFLFLSTVPQLLVSTVSPVLPTQNKKTTNTFPTSRALISHHLPCSKIY